MRMPELSDLIQDLQLAKQLKQARQIAIEERKPSAMIQATATIAKLTGLDKPINDVTPQSSQPVVINVIGVSPDNVAQTLISTAYECECE